VVLFEITCKIPELQLINLLKGIFCKKHLHILTWIHGSEIAIFLFGNKLRDFQELETSISRVRLFFHDETGKDIFCGVSSFYSDLTSLKKSYDEASSFITEFGPTQMKAEFHANGNLYKEEHHREKKLLQALTNKEEAETLEIIQQYYDSSTAHYRAEYLAYLLISTVGSILAKTSGIRLRFSLALQKFEIAEGDKEAIYALLQTLVSESIEELGGISVYNNVSLVKKATRYILEHYQQKITLQDVADYLQISYGHLSKCFRQITNLPFNQYLLEIRIREAMKLMDSTNLSSSEIGYQVGITDPNYFSKSFKKFAGVSPKEYRTMTILGKIQS
jgi:two-component system response regulator YesN